MVIWSHNSGLALGRRGRERPSCFTATSPWACCLHGKSAVSGFIQPDHSTCYWKRSPGRCLALVSECRERGEERMSTVPCCTWLRSQEVILLEQRCEKTVRTRPGSGGKSMSLKHTVFHLHHSFFLTSLVTHQENAWPATPCTKYNSA